MTTEVEKKLIKQTAKELKSLGLVDEDEPIYKPTKEILSEEDFHRLILSLSAATSYSDRLDVVLEKLKSNVLITRSMYLYIENYFSHSYSYLAKVQTLLGKRIVEDLDGSNNPSNSNKIFIIITICLAVLVFAIITAL